MSRQTDFTEIKRLKARNRTLKQEANLWYKRVNEAAEAVKDYEDVCAENRRLKALSGQVTCAYCGMVFFGAESGDTKEKMVGLVATHITICDKSPLVQNNKRLRKTLRAEKTGHAATAEICLSNQEIIRKLERAFKKYATHDPDCHKVSRIGVDNDCTCGFEQALKEKQGTDD